MLSALIVFLPGRYDVSSSLFSPLRNLFLESLFMYALFQFEEKKNNNLSEWFWKKSFLLLLPAEERTSLWLRRVKKAWEKQPCDGWQEQAITDNIPATVHIEDITHTNTPTTIYAHVQDTKENVELSFVEKMSHYSQNPVEDPCIAYW